MASDSTKVGNAYIEIRAQMKQLSKDLAAAENATREGAGKIQKQLDKSLDFEKMKVAAVGAAAGIYGALRMVGQAIESAKVGSVLDKQSKSFSNLADAAGTSSKRILDSLKQSSEGLVAESDLMAAAGKAMLMSIPADKITELMKIAAATSKMTGQSITEAFNDITMGVARQSRMILDNLGIIVDVDEANKKYAQSLGTTADALSDAQKKQAFMNAVLDAGADMIKRLGSTSGSLDGVNKLIAAQADLWTEVSRTIAGMLDNELTSYARMLTWINEKLKSMRAGAGDSSRSDMMKEIEMLRSLESKGMAQPGTTMNKMAEFNKRFGISSEAEIADKAAFKKFREAEASTFIGSQRVADNQIGYDVEARWKIYEDGLKRQAEAAKAAQEEIKKFSAEIKKLEDDFAASKIFSGESSNYERLEAQLRSGTEVYNMMAEKEAALQKQRDKIYEEDKIANDKRWADVNAGTDESMRQMLELTERTASAMQDNFSNLFFDAMTGKLKTLEDYAKAVFDAIARMASDITAQMATEALFGNLSKTGGGGGGGGLLGSILGMFGGNGGGYTGTNTYGAKTGDWGATMHSGGIAGVSGGPMRSIPASYFASAPRLHNGLMPDEYPAVLQRGERVIKRGGSAGNNVTVNVSAPNGRMDRESLSTLQSGLFAALSRSNRRNG